MIFNPNIKEIKNLEGRITIDTRITDVPRLLNEIIEEFGTFLRLSLAENFADINQPLEDFILLKDTETKEAMKAYIDNINNSLELILTENTFYNINTQHSKLSDTSLNTEKLGGKTYNELLTIVQQRTIDYFDANGAKVVQNSLKFEGYTLEEIKQIMLSTVVETAIITRLNTAVPNSNKFNNMTSTEYRDYIIGEVSNLGTDASSLGGKTYSQILSTIKNLSESVWNSSLFGGKTEAVWIENIKKLKVADSVLLNGKTEAQLFESFQDMLPEIQPLIDASISALLIKPSFKTLIENNSERFNNKLESEWLTIIKQMKVDNAVEADNASTLENKTLAEINQYIIGNVTNNTSFLDALETIASGWTTASSTVARGLESAAKEAIISEAVNSATTSITSINDALFIKYNNKLYNLSQIKEYTLANLLASVNPTPVTVAKKLLNSNNVSISYDQLFADLEDSIMSETETFLHNNSIVSKTEIFNDIKANPEIIKNHGTFNTISADGKIEISITRKIYNGETLNPSPVKSGYIIKYELTVRNISGSTLTNCYVDAQEGVLTYALNGTMLNNSNYYAIFEYKLTDIDIARGWHDNEFGVYGQFNNNPIIKYANYP